MPHTEQTRTETHRTEPSGASSRATAIAAAGAAAVVALTIFDSTWMARAQEPVERIVTPVEGVGALETEDEDVPAAPLLGWSGDVSDGVPASALLHVPITKIYPGDVKIDVPIDNPSDDPESVQRGMRYYNQFNCIGCHAPNGSGGMGPSLSNAMFVYGSEPKQIYLSILQGRPAGMPVWGGMLPEQVIWDLVAYIQSISKKPSGSWGATVSADGYSVEQVPAEYLSTTEPWDYTTPFSYGQAPFEKPKGSPPLETPHDGEPAK